MSGYPPPPGGHDEYEELAAAYALDALEPGEGVRLEAHLAGCAACRGSLDSFREVAARLGDVSGQEPPAQLGAAILAAALADAAARPPADPTAEPAVRPSKAPVPIHRARLRPGWRAHQATRRPGGPSHRATAVAAAAAVIVAGAVAGGLAASSAGGPPAGVGAACAATAGCHTVVLTDRVTHRRVATLVIDGRTARLVPQGLPADDPSRDIYVLWQITDRRNPLPVGSFDVRRSSRRAIDVGTLAETYPATRGFAVSLQRGRRIPPRPSSPVALGTVSG
jgi:anti-sigma factor RsiW